MQRYSFSHILILLLFRQVRIIERHGKIAEGVKGEKITKREKLVIAGIVRGYYPIQRKAQNKKFEVLILL